MATYYIANRNLRIPNGPGQIPSSIRVEKGDIFSLDGTEPLDVASLLSGRAIIPCNAPVGATEGQHTRSGVPDGESPTHKRKPALRRKGA